MSGRKKVWLVGAGPGDPGLLTIRAREVIENAQVIVYDRLIGPGLAEFFPQDATTVYVGKRLGEHAVVQDEIEEILIREALLGKRVVRVKGGDPFLFGRGGEEALSLMAAGIEVEIVPGVTSAISVPAYAGIPVTHRGQSAGVYIVTAHRAGEEDLLDYNLLARVADTLVILMGAGRIAEIAQRLVEAGKAPQTPVAVVQNGTTARMKSVVGDLSSIGDLILANKIDAPAVIVIGPVAQMAAHLDWRRSLPLAGVRVWLTESKKRTVYKEGESLPLLLRNAGAEVAHVPCIVTEAGPWAPPKPAGDSVPRPRIESQKIEKTSLSFQAEPEKINNLSNLLTLNPGVRGTSPPAGFGAEPQGPASATWLVFSSQAGVDGFFDALRRERLDVRSLGDCRIAAVGPSTADALLSRGLLVDYVPEIHDGKHLAEGLAVLGLRAGARVILCRCEGELPAWREVLVRAGAEVVQFELYRVVKTPSPVLKSVRPGDIVVFKSASAVEVFAGGLACDRGSIYAVCIGEPSAKAALKRGFDVTTAERVSDEAIFRAVAEAAARRGEADAGV